MVIAFAATMILYQDEEEKPKQEAMLNRINIASPIKGTVIKLEQVKDDAFASGILGKGTAVLPEDGNVCAPADGVEILIHIGLDTVQLNGKGFKAHISQGDKVKKGQLMVSFDKEFIEKQGFCIETPVIITNTQDYLEVVETGATQVKAGASIMTVLK